MLNPYSELCKLIDNNTYSDEKRQQHIMEFIYEVVTGTSMRHAALRHGLHWQTVQSWRQKGWLHEALELARTIKQHELDSKLSKIIDRAMSRVEDGLVNGDEYIDKNGNIYKKKVPAAQAATILGIAYDKRALIRGEPTTISDNRSEADRLKELQEQFQAIGQEKIIEGEVLRDDLSSDEDVIDGEEKAGVRKLLQDRESQEATGEKQ